MPAENESKDRRQPRPFIGMHFRCCHVYARLYLNADHSAFTGACPRCGSPVRIPTRPGGSRSRFWSAG